MILSSGQYPTNPSAVSKECKQLEFTSVPRLAQYVFQMSRVIRGVSGRRDTTPFRPCLCMCCASWVING